MRITTDRVHHAWDNSIPPVVEIEAGDRIEVDLMNASGGQLDARSTADSVTRLDFTRVNPVTGPIRVRTAMPGDALAVKIVELEVADWGWTANIPGFGLLSEDFPDAHLVKSTVDSMKATLESGPRLPTVPMIGTLGVALPEPGAHSLVPPSRFGGNMDIRHVTAGATVVLPVGVPGALLSVGDAHAAMGDGEICGTGVETAARAVLEVTVIHDRAPRTPLLHTAPVAHRSGPAFATTGIAPDLMTATRDAARAMVDEVARRTGLSPVDAYLLASTAGDLKISEVVDVPNWVVSLHLPSELLD